MFTLLLAAALTFTDTDAELAYSLTGKFVESCTPRVAGTIRGRAASFWILDNASSVGANVRRDQFVAKTSKGDKVMANLYAEFPATVFDSGPTGQWIVVISHFDTKSGVDCPGANDGASTTALLISLANRIFDLKERPKNILLVWADGEECFDTYSEKDGLFGSKRAVEYIRARGYDVRAAVCVDMLGDKDLKITIPSNSTESLAKIAKHAARRIGEDDLVTFASETVTDDHVPFLSAGFSAIDLIDFSYGENNCYWHTAQDTVDKLSVESFRKSGALVAELINLLFKLR